MSILLIVLLVAAAVCFLIAALGVVASKADLVALGLLLWIVAYIIQTVA